MNTLKLKINGIEITLKLWDTVIIFKSFRQDRKNIEQSQFNFTEKLKELF